MSEPLSGSGGVYALLSDGTTALIRQATPDDFEAVKAMHEEMSPANAHLRFFSLSRTAPDREARRISREPDDDHAALLAIYSGQVVGVASYEATRGEVSASPTASPRPASPDQPVPTDLPASPDRPPGEDGGPFLVTDIGGGSTEFVISPTNAAVSSASGSTRHISVNIGCVRITERRLHSDPPTAEEVTAATEDIDAALDTVAAKVPVTGAETLVGLAGSVTTVAGIALGLDHYDSERIHHSRVSAARAGEIASQLLAQTRAERAAIPVMHPGRVDVIGAGALILDRIMTRFGFTEVLVSEHDILDGIAWSLVL